MTESTNSSIPTELMSEQMILYAILKNSGMRKKESVALLSLLSKKEVECLIEQIAELMDNNDWNLPTEQEIMEIVFPILKAKSSL